MTNPLTFLFPFIFICISVTAGEKNNFASGLIEIDNGQFKQAEIILKKVLKKNQQHPINKAIALKRLGNVQYKLGKKPTSYLEKFNDSIDILTPLVNAKEPKASEELGYVLYQKANCLLGSSENELRLKQLQGIEMRQFFAILNDYISPAQRSLKESMKYYPPKLTADIPLLNGDIELQLARLYLTYQQASSAKSAYIKAKKHYKNALINEHKENYSSPRLDLQQKALVQISVVSREQSNLQEKILNKTVLYKLAIEQAEKAKDIQSGNEELNISATLNWVSLVLDNKNTKNINYKKMETILLGTADKVETLRKNISSKSSFSDSSKYFSTRTGVYELLVELYAMQDKPEKMLTAIEQMKARAFKDLLNKSQFKGAHCQFDLKKLQKKLGKQNAGLVEYFYGSSKAWIIFVSEESIRFQQLKCSGQELVSKISKVLSGFSDFMKLRIHARRSMRGRGNLPAMTNAYNSAFFLYKSLLEPVDIWAKEANVSMIYIVPYHIMNYLPFSTLVTKLDNKNLVTSKYYIEEGYPLAYLPAASILTEIKAKKYSGDALFFARTDFTSYPPEYPSNLTNTIKEVRDISKTLKGQIYSEKQALEDILVKNQNKEHSVLYFATHGHLDKTNPLHSHILLTASKSNDGKLTVAELFEAYNGKLKTEIAVLSACQTNRGEINPSSGDDISTLGRAFIIAGAKSVIATQWDASDDTFPPIMSLFMNNYINNNNSKKAISLKNAIKIFLAKPDIGFYRYPIFWGNIVLIGDGN